MKSLDVMFLIESGILLHIKGPLYLKDCLVWFNIQYLGKTSELFLVFLAYLLRCFDQK